MLLCHISSRKHEVNNNLVSIAVEITFKKVGQTGILLNCQNVPSPSCADISFQRVFILSFDKHFA